MAARILSRLPSRFARVTCLPAAFALGIAAPALAQDDEDGPDTPEAVQKLYDCRAVAEPMERLACYDAQVAVIEAGEESEELVFADKGQIREARRGLFGLSLPRIRLFDGGEEDEFSEITTTITRATRRGDGSWFFEMEDGASWVQNDTFRIYSDIKPGTEVTIKKGALSSYSAKIGNKRAIKVKRVQ